MEVELLIGLGGFTAYQTRTNSECHNSISGSERMGAKVHARKGNNPDHRLKVPKCVLS
jgi:hypothetical protein